MNTIDKDLGLMEMMLCGDRRESGGSVKLGLVPALTSDEIAASDEAAIYARELIRRGEEWGAIRGGGNWFAFNLYLLRTMIPEGWLDVGRVIIFPKVVMADSTDEKWMLGLYCSGDDWQMELYSTSEGFGKETFFLRAWQSAEVPIPQPASAERHDDGLLGNSIGP